VRSSLYFGCFLKVVYNKSSKTRACG